MIAVGEESTILRSVDDGLTWTSHQSDQRWRLKSVALVGTDVYAVGDSSDGGAVLEISDCGDGPQITIRKIDNKLDGAVNAVAADAEGRIFVTTVLHAEGRILCSKEKGVDLKVCDDVPALPFYGLFVAKAGRVFVAGGYNGKLGGVVRSTSDHGATWKTLGDHLGEIAYGIWGDPDGKRLFAATPGSLYRSSDSGASWSPSPVPMMGGGSMALGDGDAPYVPNDFATSIHGSTDSGTFFIQGGGVMRGKEYGSTLEGFSAKAGAPRFHAAVTTGNGHWIGVGDTGGITRSVDDGKSWTVVSKNDLPGDGAFVDIVAQNSATYVLRDAALLRSDDGAKTFTMIEKEDASDDHPNVTRDFVSFAVDASVVLLPRPKRNVIARSTDRGTTFSEIPLQLGPGQKVLHVVAGNAGMFYASGAAGALLRSRDEGATFARLPLKTKDLLAAPAVSNHDVYVTGTSTAVYAGGDIFHSRDDGDTWSTVAIANFDPFGIAVAGADVYAVDRYGDFMRSIDDGANWTKIADLDCGDVQGFVVQDQKIFVACGSGRLFTSTDRGATFVMKPMLAQLELLFSDAHGGLFAASDRGWPQLIHYF